MWVLAAPSSAWTLAYASAPDPGMREPCTYLEPEFEQAPREPDQDIGAGCEEEPATQLFQEDARESHVEEIEQLGAWRARHDGEAVDAAKQVSREKQAAKSSADQASAVASSQVPALADRVPALLTLAAASLAAALTLLAVGRFKGADMTKRIPAPTKRRSIQMKEQHVEHR